MIAIIKNDNQNSYYVSRIFAIKWDNWESKCIVFNNEMDSIEVIKIYDTENKHIIRKVFIIKYEEPDCKNGDWEGIDWVVNNQNLMKELEKGQIVSLENYPQFKQYANKIKLPEWLEVKEQADINGLMEASFDFHDSYPIRAEQNGKDFELEVNTTWGCYITMKFIDVTDMDIINTFGLIYNSEIKFEKDNSICWTITGFEPGWIDNIDWESDIKENPYIKCKRLLWKIDIY